MSAFQVSFYFARIPLVDRFDTLNTILTIGLVYATQHSSPIYVDLVLILQSPV